VITLLKQLDNNPFNLMLKLYFIKLTSC